MSEVTHLPFRRESPLRGLGRTDWGGCRVRPKLGPAVFRPSCSSVVSVGSRGGPRSVLRDSSTNPPSGSWVHTFLSGRPHRGTDSECTPVRWWVSDTPRGFRGPTSRSGPDVVNEGRGSPSVSTGPGPFPGTPSP